MPAAPFPEEDLSPVRVAIDRALREGISRAGRWALEHWLALAMSANALFVAVAVLDPILWAAGFDGAALPIWNFYHLFCVQEHLYYVLGHPVALCQRNLAIFCSLLAGMALFACVRRWLPPLGFWGYVALMIPMALDGFTQLFGWRESTIALRTFTGVLFGLASIWYLFPNVEAAVDRLLAREDAAADAPLFERRDPLLAWSAVGIEDRR
jgi:uncharacterized membrane protein